MPTRTRPPRHLADLTASERREAAVALGVPAYRADQLSRHYFARLTDDPMDLVVSDVDARHAVYEKAAVLASAFFFCDTHMTNGPNLDPMGNRLCGHGGAAVPCVAPALAAA